MYRCSFLTPIYFLLLQENIFISTTPSVKMVVVVVLQLFDMVEILVIGQRNTITADHRWGKMTSHLVQKMTNDGPYLTADASAAVVNSLGKLVVLVGVTIGRLNLEDLVSNNTGVDVSMCFMAKTIIIIIIIVIKAAASVVASRMSSCHFLR